MRLTHLANIQQLFEPGYGILQACGTRKVDQNKVIKQNGKMENDHYLINTVTTTYRSSIAAYLMQY